MEQVSMKQAALDYAGKGMSIFPVMTKRNDPVRGITGVTDISQVEKNWQLNFNIGLATGDSSNIIVVTFDSEESFQQAQGKGFPLTPVVKRGKCYDVYFQYRDDIEANINYEAVQKMTVLGNGKYSLLPPSVVKPLSALAVTETYSWCEGKSILDTPLAGVPNWLLRDGHMENEAPVVGEIQTVQVENVSDSIEYDHPGDVVGVEPSTDSSNDNKQESVTNEWKAPKLFDRYHVEQIKSDVLPSWLGDYTKAISESKQTPEGLAVMLGLSMVATCVQKKYVVAPHGDDEYTEPLALWTATVLKSGERKSPVLSALREPLISWQREQAELLKDQIFETSTAISIAHGRIEKLHKDAVKLDNAADRQDILNQINEIKRAMPVEVKAPVLWTADVTAEELQDMLVEHGERMALLADEGNIFAVMAGLYNDNKVNMDVFLQSYSGISTRVDRRSRKAELKNPALTFGIAIQPTVIEAFANGNQKQFRDKGALARFLYCIPESMLGKRDSGNRVRVPENVKTRYCGGIKSLLAIPTPDQPQMLTLDDEAYELWLAFDGKVEKMMAPGGELEQMNDWGAKLTGNMLRIAGLMHLVENETGSLEISKDTMAKAVHLCELLIEHGKAAYGMAGAIEPNADAKKVFNWIKDNEFKLFTKSDCHSKFKSKPWSKEKLDHALDELMKRDIIKELRVETPGKTATHYISNPALS